MSGLNKMVFRILKKVITDSTKIEFAVEDLIKKFDSTCPPKEELLDLISQKNNLQAGLQQVINKLTPVSRVAEITDNVIDVIQVGLTIFKAIPSPPFAPTGLLASSIDELDDFLKKAEGTVNIVPQITDTVIDISNNLIIKLQQLETLLSKCVEDLSEGMTPEEKNTLIKEINTATVIDKENEDNLLDRLKPGASDPYLYQKTGYPTADWQIIIEHDQANEFSFPSRRVKAINTNRNPSNIYRGVTVYNDSKEYSYSSSVQVLIEEIKYVIERLRR